MTRIHPHLTAILEREAIGPCLGFVFLALHRLLPALKDSDFFEVDIPAPVISDVSRCHDLADQVPTTYAA